MRGLFSPGRGPLPRCALGDGVLWEALGLSVAAVTTVHPHRHYLSAVDMECAVLYLE